MSMTNMTGSEKADMLKSTISHLYSNEGRSISYIGRLLGINRRTVSKKIAGWELPEAEPRRHFTPSIQKFVNKNRQLIKARLDADIPVTKITGELNVSRDTLNKTVIPTFMEYDIIDMPYEIWRPVLGYDGYMVSNMGRVKHYSAQYGAYHLLSAYLNKSDGRMYVTLYNKEKKKNLSLARIVAHTFVAGYSETRNTVNHKDGNVSNNSAFNLEWVSQSENNIHSYRKLNRPKVRGRRYDFRSLIYNERFEFKTVAAFARFIGKSETQARRYIESPSKHGIRLVK